MSEIDYLELISTLRSEGASHGMNFFAIWSAYVVAVYLLGEKMSNTFSILLSAIYTFFLVGPVVSMIAVADALSYANDLYRENIPNVDIESMLGTYELFLGVVYSLAWLLSILFLLKQRNVLKWS